MQNITETINLLIAKRERLNVLRQQSESASEAVQIADEYHALLKELEQQIEGKAPQIVPVPYPYPVAPQPVYPWWQPSWIYRSSTTGDQLPGPSYQVVSATAKL